MATKDQLIEVIVKTFPYPDQITGWDQSEDGAIRFAWRGTRFRVSESGSCDEIEGSFLSGSNIAILASSLIRPALVRINI